MKSPLPRVLAITGNPQRFHLPSAIVVAADDYLCGALPNHTENPIILNLCRSTAYLSRGYYVSLVAEGRGHPVQPTVQVLEAASNAVSFLRTLDAAGIPTTIPRRPKRSAKTPEPQVVALEVAGEEPRAAEATHAGGQVVLNPAEGELLSVLVVLGRTLDPRFRKIAAAVYREFPLPVFVLKLLRDRTWKVCGISLRWAPFLGPETMKLLDEGIQDLARAPSARPARSRPRPSIACLIDLEDEFSPSTSGTLERFAAAAQRLGANFNFLTRHETQRLAEHDALFIRTLTGLDRWTFGVQQKAVTLEIPVVDDPLSTIRCSNKVYLYEMLQRLGLAQPRGLVVTPQTPFSAVEPLGFPLIVKQPDGSFSQSVKRVRDIEEYKRIASAYFKRSPLLLLQEYLPSEFDWRIGVLGDKVLFACRYFMAKGHWQVLKATTPGLPGAFGRIEAVGRDRLDPAISELALAATRPIGIGLYGVDLKETSRGPVIIEINDNPNIDEGYEDQVEKSRLYEEVIGYFLARIREDNHAAESEATK